jgi:hypothetical protein
MRSVPPREFGSQTARGHEPGTAYDYDEYAHAPFQCACGETHRLGEDAFPVRETPRTSGIYFVAACGRGGMTLLKARGILHFKRLEPQLWALVETEADRDLLALGRLTARGDCQNSPEPFRAPSAVRSSRTKDPSRIRTVHSFMSRRSSSRSRVTR